MRKRILARVTGFVLALAVCTAGLAGILEGLGTGGELMLSLMRRHAPSDSTGLPEEEYAGMCAMITGFLGGSVDTFQYTWDGADGTRYLSFHDYEQQHMDDVRSLFVLARTVLLISSLLAAVCIFAVYRIRRRRETLQGLRDGAAVLLGVIACLLAWGLLDFDSFFTAFHRVAFTNSLWLLDPSTDLLIRLMPAEFFMEYAALAAGTFLCIPLLLFIVPQCMIRKERKQYAKQSDTF